MLIECILKRAEPIEVPIGNERYKFEEDEKGRLVCEVWLEDHINSFLSCDSLYRPLAGDEANSAVAITKTLIRGDVMKALRTRGLRFRVTAKTEDLAAMLKQAERDEAAANIQAAAKKAAEK